MRLWWIGGTLLLLGCVNRYAVPVPNGTGGWLGPQSAVYIAVPKDGQDTRPRTYVGSGNRTTKAMARALSACGLEPTVGPHVDTAAQALDAGRAAGAHFVVYSTIEHWADRVSGLTGLSDRIVLRVTLTEVPTRRAIDVRRLEATAPMWSFGEEHPEDLLHELTQQWVNGLCAEPGD
jgi:hypothetical protein